MVTTPARARRETSEPQEVLAVLAGLLMAAATSIVPAGAMALVPMAKADESQNGQFYTPPDPLSPARPGDLNRTEPARLAHGFDLTFGRQETFTATMLARRATAAHHNASAPLANLSPTRPGQCVVSRISNNCGLTMCLMKWGPRGLPDSGVLQ
jgi:hypothetical protein